MRPRLRLRLRDGLARLGIRYQLWALFGLFLLTGLSVLVIDEIAQYRARQSLLALQNDSLQRLRLIKAVSDGYGLDVVDTTFRVRNYLISWDRGVAVLDRAQARIGADWTRLAAMPQRGEQRALLAQVAQARARADRAAATLRTILRARDIAALGRFADTELYPAIDPVTTRLQRLGDLALVDADAIVRADLVRSERASLARIGLSLLALAVIALIGRAVLRRAYRSVESLSWLVQRMRAHDFTAMPDYLPRGELAGVTDAFIEMRRDVLAFETELTEQLARNERIRDALHASEQRAQAANEAKSQFLAAMSHEIRTPMIGVTGMLEVLAHTRLDGEQRHALNVIQQSAQALLQIIGDILDFSKIEAGRQELAPVAVDLPALLRATVANYAGAASSKGLALECEVDPRVAPAHCADPLRLRQVLGNFLSNAIKFTERGGVVAALELQGEGDDGALDNGVLDNGMPDNGALPGAQRLLLRVTDSGIGVSAEQQARLFEPFSQAEGDTARRFGGTGLGLAICRRLATLMGGEVTMQSAPGAGTTLRLTLALPIADPADVAPAVVRPDAAAAFSPRRLPTAAEAEAERSLVLLVDDHPINRLVIARQLALAGYACETAADGVEALAQWRGGRYALVLSDVHMPGMDGYALTGAIRAEEARAGRARTPVVALTAAAMKGEAERCLAAGMDDYLSKPVPVATLAACLRRWLPHTAPAEGDATFAAAIAAGTVLPQLERPRVLDEAVLAELGGGDAAGAGAILDDFLDVTAQDLAGLAAARDAGDVPAAVRQAHKIKGAARLVGAVELAASALVLERHGHDGALAALAPLVADLEHAAQRLRLYATQRSRNPAP